MPDEGNEILSTHQRAPSALMLNDIAILHISLLVSRHNAEDFARSWLSWLQCQWLPEQHDPFCSAASTCALALALSDGRPRRTILELAVELDFWRELVPHKRMPVYDREA
ncbi:hypothetical protein MRX96_059247 [Rhipicephalus microplus]